MREGERGTEKRDVPMEKEPLPPRLCDLSSAALVAGEKATTHTIGVRNTKKKEHTAIPHLG